ncbi:MAG: pyrroline-5-carboxylate reductase [Sphaerochaetaceae bacterium]
MKTIGFVGCGNMGGAIVNAIAKDPEWNIFIHTAHPEHAREIARRVGGNACALDELMAKSQLVVLAVKPQVLPYLYGTLKPLGADKRWISLAAGVSLETLEKELGSDQIVRLMPNIAAQISRSVTAVSPHHKADPVFVEEVFNLVHQFGTAYGIPENQLSAFIGVSGSAIATCCAFLHGVAMGGVDAGLPYPTALALIRDTMDSAIALSRETGKNPIDLLTSVCSAGGTTIQSMKALAEGGFEATLMESVIAATEKAKAMEDAARRHS